MLRRFGRKKKINENLTYRIFKWYELGILGVGISGAPFVDMSSYIDFDSQLARDAEAEIKQVLANPRQPQFPKNNAYVPEDVNDKKWLNYYIWRAEEYIPPNVMNAFTHDFQVASWLYKNKVARLNWNRMSYIVRPPATSIGSDKHLNFTNMHQGGHWIENIPSFKAWLESFNIFEDIGRIVLFENSPNEVVSIHRDSPRVNGRSIAMHNLSIQFKAGRPTFVYDEVTKEKFYHSTKAYCFNISDNHGVDSENTHECTIRIDGTFKPEICEALGLTNGAIWCKDYPTFNKFKNIQIYEPEERP